MTRLAYSRLPTVEGDPDVEIQMPQEPKTTATWKFVAPCLLLFVFLVVYMDVLSFDLFPNKFLHFRSESIDYDIKETSLREIYESTAAYPFTETTKIPTTTATSPMPPAMSLTITITRASTSAITTTSAGLQSAAVFTKRREVAHVDCARLLRDDKAYAKEIGSKRPKLVEHVKLDMSCDAIQKRILPARNPDTGLPILYTRIVNTDYEFLEEQLATNYARENVFCFSIDKKASRQFHERIFNLESCMPNVVVAKKEEDVDGSGHNQNQAHLDCMGVVRDRKWEYAMLLQNHDVMIKTHGEMTEILKIYGGANDVEISKCHEGRCPPTLEKNLGKLELCPKSLRGAEMAKCKSSSIQWGKGAMQAILSRAAVDFIFDEINLAPLVKEMNDMGFGVDEQLYESLQITPEIRLPGGFHDKCRDTTEAQYISRISIWTGDCKSGRSRHAICLYGVEDLPFLAESKFVMANKMMPDFDHAVTSCISEMLFNRTRDGSKIDRNYYEKINTVRYHHQRNDPGFDISKFKCAVFANTCLLIICYLVAHSFVRVSANFLHSENNEIIGKGLNVTTRPIELQIENNHYGRLKRKTRQSRRDLMNGVEGAVFRKRPEVAHVDCTRLISDDKEYAKEIATNRPKLVERGAKLGMSCPAIHGRFLPARNPNTGFPIMYARLVYKDYEFLEDQLISNYATENVYCFSIDMKAPWEFHDRFSALENCLSNVIVTTKFHDLDSSGHNHNEAHLDCMKAAKSWKWNYVMTLQNNDMLIKTHAEMTEILKIYGGANDVEIKPCPDERCLPELERNLGILDICPKGLKGDALAKCNASEIQWAKGAIQVILSRATVDYIIDKLNIDPLLWQLNAMDYGVDELFYQSLLITPALGIPGGFTNQCMEKETQYISKLSLWQIKHYGFWESIWRKIMYWFIDYKSDCLSGYERNRVCVYGVEDLPMLAESKFVMANKVLPNFDQAVTSCISELLFNRTRDGSKIDRKYYERINTVRYYHDSKLAGFNNSEFECEA